MNNKLFKKIIGIFGYKLVDKSVIRNERLLGSQSFLNINLILNKIFKNYEINYLVQVGANDGIRFDELNKYIKNNKTKSILVEPIKKYFEQLKKNYDGYTNVYFENSAIDDMKSDIYLFKVSNKYIDKYDEHVQGINSFNKKHLLKHGVKNSHIETEKINIISIIDLLKKYNINNLDLLFIDAEGHDANIIIDLLNKSNQEPIIIFEYIHIEHEMFKILIQKLNLKKFNYFKVNENIVCIPSRLKNIL